MDKKKTSKIYKPLMITMLSGSLLVGFLLLNEPSQSNFSFSLIPLLLLWFFIYGFFSTVFCYLEAILAPRIKKIVSTSMASVVVVSVMFSALGQLQVFDVILLILLVLLGIFYFSRTWPK